MNKNKIQEIVDKELDIRKSIEYKQTINIFDITKSFIKRKGLMLYGGAALNALVKDKFYKKHDLPDYDFISYDAQKHAKELANLYGNAGYKYTEAKPGNHYGTYKVYASFVPVADITQIPKSLFLRMKKKAVYAKDLKLYTVPLDYLRMAIYIELSRPAGDISRWSKIYERLQLFNKYHPVTKPRQNIYIKYNLNESLNQILNVVKDFIIFKKLVIFGTYGFSQFVPQKNIEFSKLDKKMSFFDVLSLKAHDSIQELSTILKNIGFHLDSKKQNIKSIKLFGSRAITKRSGLSSNEFFGTHFSLSYKNNLIINIFQTEACYSFFTHNNMRIATIDTMLSFFYAFKFTTRDYINVDKVQFMIEHLFQLQKNNKLSKNIKFQRFGFECYGNQKTLIDLKKEKHQRIQSKNSKMKVYRPLVRSTKKKVQELIYL